MCVKQETEELVVLMQTCQFMHRIAEDSSLWISIDANNKKSLTDEQLLAVATSKPKATVAILNMCVSLTERCISYNGCSSHVSCSYLLPSLPTQQWDH